MKPDLLVYSGPGDVAVRVLAVGIFVIENVNHLFNFSTEVEELVQHAVRPLSISMAYALHALTVTLGLSGSILVC